jgi:SAM-dependent methyltransferase
MQSMSFDSFRNENVVQALGSDGGCIFPSKLAHTFLDGLTGIEIGGASHNSFGLQTIKVDKSVNKKFGGTGYEHVDVLSQGDDLPFPDNSVDFIISSHVLEHFFDPIKALKEWRRVARKYIFMIIPNRDALLSDVEKPLTPVRELVHRHIGSLKSPDMHEDKHHSRWTLESFLTLLSTMNYNNEYKVVAALRKDDKIGNGFCVVLDVE